MKSFLLAVVALVMLQLHFSCTPPANPIWDELFALVQNATPIEGKVVGYRAPQSAYPYPYTTTDLIEAEIEYKDGQGQVQRFWELWPIQEKRHYPENTEVLVYEWPENKLLPRATKTLLRAQKAM
mgnify:CR=1 FL=1